ncbi:MAG: glutamate--tRNA ligase [Candidatus Omnitrophica bacterium]|nr:glutamate--tRNA ligase [Candidatus Omnitrophota bacterium]
MTLRVRCAPSPTGYLHIGVTRTALFNELLARNQGGKFLLRIEDTDRERSKDEFIESILKGFEWFGIVPDEPPIRQSERSDYYQGLIQQLLAEGKAYFCNATKEELAEMREQQVARGENPHYDGRNRDRTDIPAEGSVVRIKTPREGMMEVEDPIYGTHRFDLSDIDDFVIAKSDGLPTYQFAVVADDHDQGVTLVLRGNDLVPSTPRQILIYEAFGWKPPEFAHLPMILGKDKQKMSKRHGATSLLAYRAMGYLPIAMMNYLIRLGWSHGDQEVFTREEMVEHFSLKNISKSPAVFNPEKLLWVNAEHIRRLVIPELTNAWIDHLENYQSDQKYLEGDDSLPRNEKALDIDIAFLKDPANRIWVETLVGALQERSDTLIKLTDQAWPFLSAKIDYDPKAVKKVLKSAAKEPLEQVLAWVDSQGEQLDPDAVHEALNDIAAKLEVGMGKVAQPVRVAVTGTTVSPPINTTLQLLGKERTGARIREALELVSDSED